MIPDAEAVVIAGLAADERVTDITTRIAGSRPGTLKLPWVRVTLHDDASTDGGVVDHHIAAYMDIECWAGTEGTEVLASDLSRAVRAALHDFSERDDLPAIVTGARSSRRKAHDASTSPPGFRYIVTATVWMHS